MKRIITIFLILLTLAFPLGCSSNDDGYANSQHRVEITPADIANEMSLYAVEVECGNEASSGYIIASDATSVTVATCYHAVDGASPKIVRFHGETDFVSSDKVTFYAYDDLFDIAFLKVELGENHGKSVLGKKVATIKVGDEAFRFR